MKRHIIIDLLFVFSIRENHKCMYENCDIDLAICDEDYLNYLSGNIHDIYIYIYIYILNSKLDIYDK